MTINVELHYNLSAAKIKVVVWHFRSFVSLRIQADRTGDVVLFLTKEQLEDFKRQVRDLAVEG